MVVDPTLMALARLPDILNFNEQSNAFAEVAAKVVAISQLPINA